MIITTESAQSADLRLFGPTGRVRSLILAADLCGVSTAILLPWSTSAVSIGVALWALFFIPTIDLSELYRIMKVPACVLSFALFGLALIGMLWANTSWHIRIHGLHPVWKFFVLPFLIYHFSRSSRGHWVLAGFYLSCLMLIVVSWVAFFAGWKLGTDIPGVPVKNYIDQSQELTLCVFATWPLLLQLVKQRNWKLAAPVAALTLIIFSNLMFVAIARTAFVYIAVLCLVFAARYLSLKWTMYLFVVGLLVGTVFWFSSANLRQRYEFSIRDYKVSTTTNLATSSGERLAYWTDSLKWFAQAPLLGHGTGSTEDLFAKAAEGKSGEWANKIRNPHNQTLYVAVQWGILGCIVLYAMWYFHLQLFLEKDILSWIGLTVVVQNFVSSMLNSHLFDFQEGWIYVIGVGVVGGEMLSKRRLLVDPHPATETASEIATAQGR